MTGTSPLRSLCMSCTVMPGLPFVVVSSRTHVHGMHPFPCGLCCAVIIVVVAVVAVLVVAIVAYLCGVQTKKRNDPGVETFGKSETVPESDLTAG